MLLRCVDILVRKEEGCLNICYLFFTSVENKFLYTSACSSYSSNIHPRWTCTEGLTGSSEKDLQCACLGWTETDMCPQWTRIDPYSRSMKTIVLMSRVGLKLMYTWMAWCMFLYDMDKLKKKLRGLKGNYLCPASRETDVCSLVVLKQICNCLWMAWNKSTVYSMSLMNWSMCLLHGPQFISTTVRVSFGINPISVSWTDWNEFQGVLYGLDLISTCQDE